MTLNYELTMRRRLRRRASGGGASTITGTAPVLGPLTAGAQLSTAVTWGSAATTSPPLTGPTREMQINGGAWVAYVATRVVAAGEQFAIREVWSDARPSSRTFTSGTVAVPVAAPVNTVAPTVSGVAQVGQTLTGTEGTWTGSPTLAAQWLRAGAVIAGATGLTYVAQAGDVGALISLRITGTNAGGSVVATSAAVGPVVAAGAEVIGGVPVGASGSPGTLYEGFRLVAGDDFNAAPTRWGGRNLSGRYTHSALSFGFRGTNPTWDNAMYVDPTFRGARSESPTDLGIDRVAVASSVLTLTASAPEAEVLPLLPTTYTGGRGDAQNRPRLLSGSLKTAPSFMMSAQADWVAEARVRVPAGVARGYWPSFWTTTFFWPDRGEADIIEVVKNPDGSNRNTAVMHGNAFDGGPNQIVQVADTPWPANTWINAMARRIGNTVFFYDDAGSPGTYVLRGSNTQNVTRFTGAHDIRIDLAVATNWDGSTFNAGDWPRSVEFDWWRVWSPNAAAYGNQPTTVLSPVLTTPGGSWAATLPDAATLYPAGAGLEQVTAAWDNFDAPGMPTRNNVTRLPNSMTVNLSSRAISGTVPTTEGGAMGVYLTYAYNDGSPARRVLLPYYVAPAVQSLPSGWTYAPGAAVSEVIGYTAFHSGNLGPHTYNVTAPGLTVTGNGTGNVTLTGTASSDVTVTIACTNIQGQVTTVVRTLAVTAVQPVFVNDTFSGRANGTNLTAHTGETGHTWSKHPTAPTPNILMAAAGTVYIGNADAVSLYIASPTAPNADALVTADFSQLTFNIEARHFGVVGRCDPTAATFYFARVSRTNTGSPSLQLFRSINGTLTQLGTSFTLTLTDAAIRTIGLRMVGTTISAEIDGVARITVTDANIASAGRVGIRSYDFLGATPTTHWHLTRLTAENLSPEPPPTGMTFTPATVDENAPAGTTVGTFA